jgi:hypothetical protein
MSGWTVQLLIDCDIAVTVRCACQNVQQLNLASLKDKLGPDASAMHSDLAPRLRCTECGNRAVVLQYAPKMVKRSPLIGGQDGAALSQ